MKCSNCGNEIESGKLYCEKCGTEVQIVPTYNPLEDDDFSLVSSDSNTEVKKQDTSKEESMPERKDGESKKSFYMKLALLIIIPIILLCIGVNIAISKHTKETNSYEYRYNLAMDAYDAQDYRLAISRLSELEMMEEASPFVEYINGVCYYNLEDYEDALSCFTSYLKADNTSFSGYEYLINTYKKLEMPDKIDELLSLDYLDQDIISQYVLEAPEITSGSGTFSDDYILSMKNAHNHSMYYTLDGSDPATNGVKYLKPLKLEEGTYQIRAVCLTDKVMYNHETNALVEIKYQPPEVPTIEPAGGEITTETDIVMTAAQKDDLIYYSFDGSDPLTGGELYDGSFKIIEPCDFVIKIMAVNKRGLSSRVMTYRFTVVE